MNWKFWKRRLKEPNDCTHSKFQAGNNVVRVSRSPREDNRAEGYIFETVVRCKECGIDFRFLGAMNGMSYRKPSTSLEGTVLRIPIHPADGTEPFPPPKGVGFEIINGMIGEETDERTD